jgi:hypothetical protein
VSSLSGVRALRDAHRSAVAAYEGLVIRVEANRRLDSAARILFNGFDPEANTPGLSRPAQQFLRDGYNSAWLKSEFAQQRLQRR